MTGSETRKRVGPGIDRTGIQRTTFSGSTPVDIAKEYYYWTSEEVTSEDHPYWHIIQHARYLDTLPSRRAPGSFHPMRNRDAGGPFNHVKRWTWISHPNVYVYTSAVSNPKREYWGPMAYSLSTGASTSQYPTPAVHSLAEMNVIGTSCIAATIPTSPAASLATILGELRADGLPAVPVQEIAKSVLKRYRTARKLGTIGSEYLNYVFGWAPLINDSRQLASAVNNSQEIIRQFERDSGRQIRRRLDLGVTRTIAPAVVEASNTQPSPGFFSTQVLSTGVRTKQRTTEVHTWFSACYTYWLDSGETLRGRLRRNEQIANKLLGHRINPEVLWELTPWSWAADWIGNIGQVMGNLSALSSDSLVIRWAYVMRTTRITDTYTWTGCRFRGVQDGPITQVFTSETKTRVKATPYGFGLNPASFTNRQWAILAALGISRGSNQL
jgi:hypothetical protein